MGKGKGSLKHEPSSEAYQRINYLYQAGMALTHTSNSALPAYLTHLAKQVTKKIVGKVHPDIKRSLCKACSNPLQDVAFGGSCTLIPFKRRSKKKKTAKSKHKKQQEHVFRKSTTTNENREKNVIEQKDSISESEEQISYVNMAAKSSGLTTFISNSDNFYTRQETMPEDHTLNLNVSHAETTATSDIKDSQTTDRRMRDKIQEKKKRPNKLKVMCHRCGFEKVYLQRPRYKIWIENEGSLL